MGSAWQDTDLVFTTRTGRPIEPRNLVRSFRRICEANDVRLIKVHHIRHTVASLLKALHVPARDAQVILGHSRLAVTLEIYTTPTTKLSSRRSPGYTASSIRPEWLSNGSPLLQTWLQAPLR
jgi:integrase